MTRSLFFGGVIDGIADAFSAVADWIVGGLESIYNGIINMIQAWVMKIIYVFLKGFFLVIDFINLLFRKMCGLDSVKIDGTYIGTAANGEFEGDLALVLIQSQQVIDVFISILVVAVILLFIFTFIAIIRNQYNATDSKTKGSNGPIIGKALKALFTFLFVPAICILGIMVSNGLLRTLDGATRLSAGTSISGQIFQASANSANRIMTDDAFWEAFQADNGASGLNPNGTTFNYSTPPSSMTPREYAAILVNEAFAMNAICNADINATYRDGLAHMQSIDEVHYIKSFDFMNENIVWVYYDLTKFNWLIAFVACFFVGSALLVASIGIIQRLYEITLLFAISPPFVALMPLDDGKAFGGWRKKFIEDVLVMYGPILAVNFFFIITPILMHIDLFYTAAELEAYGATGCALFNDIGHLLFIICGALMIKEFSSLLTGIITGNDKADLMAKGGNMAGAMAGVAQKAMNAPGKMWKAGKDGVQKIGGGMKKMGGGLKKAGGGIKKAGKGLASVAKGVGGAAKGVGGAAKGVGGAAMSAGGKAKAGLKSTGNKLKFKAGTASSKLHALSHGQSTKGIKDKRIERAQRQAENLKNQNSAAGVSDEAANAFASMFGNDAPDISTQVDNANKSVATTRANDATKAQQTAAMEIRDKRNERAARREENKKLKDSATGVSDEAAAGFASMFGSEEHFNKTVNKATKNYEKQQKAEAKASEKEQKQKDKEASRKAKLKSKTQRTNTGFGGGSGTGTPA